ncbi:MAG: cytochrome c oxidase accessory protein CcoG, partial [Verrucomicrobiota bacterium]
MSTAPKPNLTSVTSIGRDGSHIAIHPADVRGRFTRARRFFGFFLLLIYALLPWISINGYPAVFLDVEHRRFHLFGLTFLAQDVWIAFFLISGIGFGLFFVTALFG